MKNIFIGIIITSTFFFLTSFNLKNNSLEQDIVKLKIDSLEQDIVKLKIDFLTLETFTAVEFAESRIRDHLYIAYYASFCVLLAPENHLELAKKIYEEVTIRNKKFREEEAENLVKSYENLYDKINKDFLDFYNK